MSSKPKRSPEDKQRATAEIQTFLDMLHDPDIDIDKTLAEGIREQVALQSRTEPCTGCGEIGFYRCRC
jgi:hypothetical protein